VISGYLGGGEDFDRAIADFALSYADQNEKDYRRLLEAVSEARVVASVGQ
jgi:molecular chaperone DnaK (HSP70)